MTEPVSIAGAITTFIESALLLLIGLGVIDITQDQVQLILTMTAAILGVVGPMLWARSQSTALADPKVVLDDGTIVPLVRADTGKPTPQAMERGMR